MLAQLIQFEKDATLIMRSGIQFMDFGLSIEPRKEAPGAFVRRTDGSTGLIRLEYDAARDAYLHPNTHAAMTPEAKLETPLAESLEVFSDVWVPVPYLRLRATDFVQGPRNWARARVVPLSPGEDAEHGHSHRVVFAFDTAVAEEEVAGSSYLIPRKADDVDGGARFALSWKGDDMGWFLDQPWVEAWLKEIFVERMKAKRAAPEEIEDELNSRRYFAHYLNLLWFLGVKVAPPRLRIVSHEAGDLEKPIQVDLVLDVGNSRSCGLLMEDHPQESNGLNNHYRLELRDLGQPHKVYTAAFESRVEFAEAAFGKVNFSAQSGRNDMFLWPTIARVGAEATRLAARRRGTEGATGLSSPKRYLWDEVGFESGWRFNVSFNKSESEPRATAAPVGDLVNGEGEALFTLALEEQIPVFLPHYSRSSLMTFMLAEVLAQALTQINSPRQRHNQGYPDKPRQLRSVVLTVPPSMPLPERQIFEERMRQAIGLVWKALDWHPVDMGIETEADRAAAWPPLPQHLVKWDEATCAQVVFLYSEIIDHFGGRPEDFFQAFRRMRPGDAGRSLRVASIDVGGGTTDLVVCDYSLDDGRGGNVSILPKQIFRDGFKIAGDDIVLDVITKVIVPRLTEALEAHGVRETRALLGDLMGASPSLSMQDKILRQQLTLQVFYPLALAVLKAYEAYDPLSTADVSTPTFGEVLGTQSPSPEVLAYFAKGVRGKASGVADFDLMAVSLPFDMAALHKLFTSGNVEVARPIRSLCEIVFDYDCDVLLLTGRPSSLPGVQALVRALLPLPPDRVIPLRNYRTGGWYPFNRDGRIDDPKTTAAVGAMLCLLGQGRLPNFFFRANEIRNYSTVKFIGHVDKNMLIKREEVYYRDVDFDDPDWDFPEAVAFPVRGPTVLGFRQLDSARWGASPLYLLEFVGEENSTAHRAIYGEDQHATALMVRLGRKRRGKVDRPVVIEAGIEGGAAINRNAVSIRLFTLPSPDKGSDSYWLDSGSIIR